MEGFAFDCGKEALHDGIIMTVAISGHAHGNAFFKVVAGEKDLGTAVADEEGNFSAKIGAQKDGTVLTITATDAVGNVQV